MELSTRDWIVLLVGIGLILALTADIWMPVFIPPTPKPEVYKYTTGLTVKFKIYDTATMSLITGNVIPEFWKLGTDPFSYNFIGQPVATAVYSTALSAWTAPLDAGSYVLTIRDIAGVKALYPVKVTVTVSGTNNEDLEVWLNPVQINMNRRATIRDATSATPCYPYDTTGIYTPVASMNTTLDESKHQTGYWFIEYAFDVSNTNELVKAGRLYFSKITNFAIEKVIVDGVQCAVYEDIDPTDDGLTGYYVPFNDWQTGRHHVTVYVHAFSQISTTTFRLTIIDYYECHRTDLRWWTPVYKDLTVTK